MIGTKMLTRSTIIAVVLVLSAGIAYGDGLDGSAGSIFNQELMKTRYNLFQADNDPAAPVTDEADLPLSEFAQTEKVAVKYKSPARAFLYSLAVPGLGQYYYGSKIKPVIFLGVEVLGWVQALKYHSNGEDLTAEFQMFNREHWSRGRYYDYLVFHYDTTHPHNLPDTSFPELVETLPDEETQQFFEMTGKYDQFAWGWDDAIHPSGNSWEDYQSQGTYPPKVKGVADVPVSENRQTYEHMRDAANDEYSTSLRYVFVIMGNHLVSAFEAYFTTKRHNNALRYEQEFAQRLDVDATVRSYHAWKDTPYLSFSYKF